MTLTIELSPDEVQRVKQAWSQGVDVTTLIHRLLAQLPAEPSIGLEIIAEWEREGVIGSRPEIVDSESHARQIREQAQQRQGED